MKHKYLKMAINLKRLLSFMVMLKITKVRGRKLLIFPLNMHMGFLDPDLNNNIQKVSV